MNWRHLNINVRRLLFGVVASAGLTLSAQVSASGHLPGEGIKITPQASTTAEEYFAAYIMEAGLEALGYEVQDKLIAQVQLSIISVCNGDSDYYISLWWPLHKAFWEQGGGDANCQRIGKMTAGALQGYLIDKKSSEAYGITHLDQFKDPELAKLFDIDGDDKADLYGCESGWGCERVQVHHMKAYDLNDTVDIKQGGYFAIIPDAIERIKAGKPTLYYTWTPLWLSGILRPGHEVVWLNVPFTSLPDERAKDEDTTVEGLGNLGFAVNDVVVIGNTKFFDANPAAKKYLELMVVPIDAVNSQNMKMAEGEDSDEDIRRHAAEWIAANQADFDSWVAQAMVAK